jgi:hypothetical protein
MPTRWSVETRAYYFGEFAEGTAQRVRAEHEEDGMWTRVLEAIYWWPGHEGKEWPATVVPGPERTLSGQQTDAWAHFEATLGMDERYRWEPSVADDLAI